MKLKQLMLGSFNHTIKRSLDANRGSYRQMALRLYGENDSINVTMLLGISSLGPIIEDESDS
jgi:hypothetical protein